MVMLNREHGKRSTTVSLCWVAVVSDGGKCAALSRAVQPKSFLLSKGESRILPRTPKRDRCESLQRQIVSALDNNVPVHHTAAQWLDQGQSRDAGRLSRWDFPSCYLFILPTPPVRATESAERATLLALFSASFAPTPVRKQNYWKFFISQVAWQPFVEYAISWASVHRQMPKPRLSIGRIKLGIISVMLAGSAAL